MKRYILIWSKCNKKKYIKINKKRLIDNIALSVRLFLNNSKPINKDKKIAFVTQTTLSIDDTKEIINILKNRFPNIREPLKEDICYATTNRQMAVKEIAPKCDMFFVVGSRNSSNSVRLVEVAKKAGCEKSMLMHSEEKLPIEELINSETIGISSGASAPDTLVQSLINNLKKDRDVSLEEVIVAEEKVIFKLPEELN